MKKLIYFLSIFCFLWSRGQEYKLGLPIGHEGQIQSAQFSPNSKLLATASFDNSVKVWDVQSGKLLHTLEEHLNPVLTTQFSPDGSLIATGSWDATAKLWNVNSGKLVHTFEGHTGIINTVQFSPDGELLLTASRDYLAKIWDVKSGKLITTLSEGSQGQWLNTAQFSPNGKHIITASRNNTATIWDSFSGKILYTLQGHSGDVELAKFSPNGKFIVTASEDRTAKIWEMKSADLLHTLEGHISVINSADFSPDGKHVVTASGDEYKNSDKTAKLWDVNTGKLLATLEGHIRAVNTVQFSPDGQFIVTASNDKTAKLWNARTGKFLATLKGHVSVVIFAHFSPDSRYIATASTDYTAKLWDVKSLTNSHTLKGHANNITSAQLGPDDKISVIIDYGRTPHLWDLKSGKVYRRLNGHDYDVNSTQFNQDGTFILTASDDETVKLWNLKSGELVNTLEGHTDVVNTVHFSPDEKLIITASDDKTAKLWDTNSGKLYATLGSHTNAVESAQFSPNGRIIVTAGREGKIKVWDHISKKFLHTLDGYLGEKLSYSQFSPDGKSLITSSLEDNSASIWELRSGKLVMRLRGHTKFVNSAQYSPDGKYIVTGSEDQTAKLWDAQTGELLHNLEGHTRMVVSTSFSPDSKIILTASWDSNVKLWDVSSGKLLKTLEQHTDWLYSANFSQDGKFIVTTSKDGSMIFWNTKNSEKYIKQFVIKNEPMWLTSDGYYFTSKEIASKLHYKKDTQIIGFEQLDIKYNRPDLVLEALGNITGSKDTIMLKAYKKAWQKRINKLEIDTSRFERGFSIPKSDFLNRDEIAFEQTNSELSLHLKSVDSTYLLDHFNIWINEVPVYGFKGISIRNRKTHTIDTVVNVRLSSGKNKIETSVYNVNGIESYKQPLYVNYKSEKEINEKLYFVGIGVDKYQNSNYNLNYSVKDIKDLSVALKNKYGNKIEIDTLFNQNVTVSNIRKLKEKLKTSTVNDKVIVSFSGHGLLSVDLDYYLATHDVNFEFPEKNGLPYEDLEYLLDDIPSRQKLLLIDACHSGEVDKDEIKSISKLDALKEGVKGSIGVTTVEPKMGMKNSFELMKELFNNVDRATGATVISAAAGTQFAQERGNLKNGVFTYCILNQLKEKETILVSELKKLVSDQVKEITNGLQQPTSRNETIENDWKVW